MAPVVLAVFLFLLGLKLILDGLTKLAAAGIWRFLKLIAFLIFLPVRAIFFIVALFRKKN